HTRIFVLDEATANLDFATEEEVRKTIDKIRHNATVIVIAHRYSMIREADHVIVLSEGRVLEAGRPEELLWNGGWFAQFAAAAEQGLAAGDDVPSEEPDGSADEDIAGQGDGEETDEDADDADGP
ncbi:MAG TPA: ABC transporter ATP-binding protein, partial [Puia sp.]|nr:ABC transporter ATP-binding protein [Puia sp.]